MNWSDNEIKKIIDKFCCDYLQLRLEKDDSRLHYDKVFRELYIERIYSTSIHTVKHCPWCGQRFPKQLRKEWFNTLKKEYNIETDIMEWRTRTDIPQEFKSDEWWKKRDL